MKRLVFNKFPSVLFHRAILLMLLGATFCMTLFVLRRRHVMKGIAQTNNERFNIKDIRIKPFEGLKTDEIYFPSTTFTWYSSTYSLPFSSSSSTTTSNPTAEDGGEGQNDAKQSQNSENRQSTVDVASVLNNGGSSIKDGTGTSGGKTFTNGGKNKAENIDLKALRDAALRKKAGAVSGSDKAVATDTDKVEGSKQSSEAGTDSVVTGRTVIPTIKKPNIGAVNGLKNGAIITGKSRDNKKV